jgi:hypothetical protein
MVMSRWRNKAITNLLKNSKENTDHAIAAKEWEFTGTVIDHLTSNHRCQLCEGENLRYHFEINNKIKQENSLLVGSSCIKKFDITVFDESGKEIFGSQKSSFLKNIIDQKKQELMLDEVRSLWKVSTLEEKKTIEYCINEYKIKNCFSPNELNKLFSLMKKHEIDFTQVLFKVSLRSQFELNRLLNMPDYERSRILPCLSVHQKKRFSEKKKQVKAEQDLKSSTTREIQKYEFPSFEIKSNRNISQLHSFKQQRTPKKESEQSHYPDYVTCSICGEFKRWVTLNPNKCKDCLEKSYRK